MRRFTRIVLPLAVFIAGLAAGAWHLIGVRARDFTARVDQRLAETPEIAPAPDRGKQRAFESDEDMLVAIMSAVAEDEPLLRAHRLHDLLEKLSSAEFAVLFDRTTKVEDRDRRGILLDVVLARWLALDPAGAAAGVRPFLDRYRAAAGRDWRSLDTTVCEAWARARPEAALAEALSAPDARWARDTARSAIYALAEGDPARQLDTLEQMPSSTLRAEMCAQAITSLAEKDPVAAEARLELLPDLRQWTRIRAEILGKLAGRDPSAALARLNEVGPELAPGTDTTRLMSAVLLAAAKHDPAGAIAAVDGLPEELQMQALGPVLVGWAGEHPVDALEWAAANGVDVSEAKAIMYYGDTGPAGWNSLLGTAFESDRTKTLAWIETQPASPARDAMLREGIWGSPVEEAFKIYADLTPAGKASAVERLIQWSLESGGEPIEPWVKAQPAGPAREAAIQSLAFTQTFGAPERIDSLADAWPAGPDRDAALRGIAWSVTRSDPMRALDFARRVADPEARASALSSLAANWLSQDETAARAWIAGAAEISPEEKRVLLRQFGER